MSASQNAESHTTRLYYWSVGAAIVSAAVSSFTYPLTAEALHHFTVAQFVLLHSLCGLLFYIPYCMKFGLPNVTFLRKHPKQSLQVFFFRGCLGDFFYPVILLMVPAVEVMFLTKLEPYLVLFFGWLLAQEKISRRGAILLAVHVAGAVVLATGGQVVVGTHFLGELLLFATLLIMAFCYRPAAHLAKELGGIHVAGLRSIFSLLTVLVVLGAQSGLGYSQAALFTWSSGWLYAGSAALVWQLVGGPLYYESLRHIPGWLASALRAVGPVCAAPVAIFVFGDTLSAVQIAGAFLVVLTSGLLAVERHREERADRKRVRSNEPKEGEVLRRAV